MNDERMITVGVATEVLADLDEWSEPVQVRLEPRHSEPVLWTHEMTFRKGPVHVWIAESTDTYPGAVGSFVGAAMTAERAKELAEADAQEFRGVWVAEDDDGDPVWRADYHVVHRVEVER